MKTLEHFNWQGKTAIVRTDLNVPLSPRGEVADDERIRAALPSLQRIIGGGGRAVVLSHLGRPAREGAVDPALSLAPVAAALGAQLSMAVNFCATLDVAEKAWRDVTSSSAPDILVLENTRFNVGEKANAPALARRYASLGDVFVMDAFASAHRAEASTIGIAQTGMPSCAGRLVVAELDALARVVGQLAQNKTRDAAPGLVGVFGGAKISTKIKVIRRMASVCETIIIGGGMANTLLKAQGCAVGQSLVQDDMLDVATELLRAGGERLLLPTDAIVATAAEGAAGLRAASIGDIAADEMILDIGMQTRASAAAAITRAKTILWNGPVGLFENPPFAAGTRAIATAIATATQAGAYSLIGGGDTIAAARACGMLAEMSYVSTAGGALLQYLAGGAMPGLQALEQVAAA